MRGLPALASTCYTSTQAVSGSREGRAVAPGLGITRSAILRMEDWVSVSVSASTSPQSTKILKLLLDSCGTLTLSAIITTHYVASKHGPC